MKKTKINELRVRIDGLAQLTKELKPHNVAKTLNLAEEVNKFFYEDFNSEEINKAVDSLYLAKAWLGKMLGKLGEATPYANDGNRKTVEDIEPVADAVKEYKNNSTVCSKCPKCRDITCGASDCIAESWVDKNHIEKVDWLRQEIQKTIEEYIMNTPVNRADFLTMLHINFTYKHLCEARFNLGFELQRIKEEK